MKTLNEVLDYYSWEDNEWFKSWSAHILKTIPWRTVRKDFRLNEDVFVTIRTINDNIRWKTRVYNKHNL